MCLSFLAVGYVFVGSLKPNARSEQEIPYFEISWADLTTISEGEPLEEQGLDGLVVVLKPTQDQLDEISSLDPHVFDSSSNAWFDDLGIYIYWKVSTGPGCVLRHAPKGFFESKPKWPGGYYDPCHDYSYDYAGRRLSSYDYSAFGYTREVENLRVPGVEVRDGKWVRIYGRFRRS